MNKPSSLCGLPDRPPRKRGTPMFARLRVAAVVALLAIPATVCAAEPVSQPDPADAIAALIDKHLAADWAARGIKPTAPADDAEFVRRVYLDLIGRAPKAAETR